MVVVIIYFVWSFFPGKGILNVNYNNPLPHQLHYPWLLTLRVIVHTHVASLANFKDSVSRESWGCNYFNTTNSRPTRVIITLISSLVQDLQWILINFDLESQPHHGPQPQGFTQDPFSCGSSQMTWNIIGFLKSFAMSNQPLDVIFKLHTNLCPGHTRHGQCGLPPTSHGVDSSYHELMWVWEGIYFEASTFVVYMRKTYYLSLVRTSEKSIKDVEVKVNVQKGILGFKEKFNVLVPSDSHLHSMLLYDNSPQWRNYPFLLGFAYGFQVFTNWRLMHSLKICCLDCALAFVCLMQSLSYML